MAAAEIMAAKKRGAEKERGAKEKTRLATAAFVARVKAAKIRARVAEDNEKQYRDAEEAMRQEAAVFGACARAAVTAEKEKRQRKAAFDDRVLVAAEAIMATEEAARKREAEKAMMQQPDEETAEAHSGATQGVRRGRVRWPRWPEVWERRWRRSWLFI